MVRAERGDATDRLGPRGRWASLKRERQAMSDVAPDVSWGKRKPDNKCLAPDVVSEKEKNMPTSGEDKLATSSLLMHRVADVGDNAHCNTSVPAAPKLSSYEQREIQPNEREVDVEFFSHLLVFYMIKEDWAKARQCRLRAEGSTTNVVMNTLMLICQHLEEGNTGAARHLIKNAHFDNSIKDLVMEVDRRIVLSVLRMVEHTYVNLETKKLCEMLDAESNDELQQVLGQVGWLEEDGYVFPKMTPELTREIEELKASPYGPIPQAFTKITYGMIQNAVDIHKLIQYATFLEVNT